VSHRYPAAPAKGRPGIPYNGALISQYAAMSSPEHSPLGKVTAYADRYDASLLFPIPRQGKRDEIGVSGAALPFHGVDVWNGYELSWLDTRGKPMVAVAEFRFAATSPNIVESKSFKLYLNSFAQERVADAAALREVLVRDLSAASGAPVDITLLAPGELDGTPLAEPEGVLLDGMELDFDSYGPPRADFLVLHGVEASMEAGSAGSGAAAGDRAQGAFLQVELPPTHHVGARPARDASGDTQHAEVRETLISHLLRSNCPVTGQPDWGSVQIRYAGAPIDHTGLLRYLVSFRNHTEFHEQCVERIFMDITARCAPRELSVYARYTRRGGLDINPFRSTDPSATPGNPRGARQ